LREYEGTFQQIGVNCVNIKKAGRTRAEYHQQVTKKRSPEELERSKKRTTAYNKNPDVIAHRSELMPCDCGALISRIKLKRHKESAIHKLFFKDPKAHAIKMQEKEERSKVKKWKCDCGSEINISQTSGAKNKHNNTPKHQNWLKIQQ